MTKVPLIAGGRELSRANRFVLKRSGGAQHPSGMPAHSEAVTSGDGGRHPHRRPPLLVMGGGPPWGSQDCDDAHGSVPAEGTPVHIICRAHQVIAGRGFAGVLADLAPSPLRAEEGGAIPLAGQRAAHAHGLVHGRQVVPQIIGQVSVCGVVLDLLGWIAFRGRGRNQETATRFGGCYARRPLLDTKGRADV